MTDRVWVPRVPTRPMIKAGAEALVAADRGQFVDDAQAVYRAMIAAAPSGEGEPVAWRVGWIGCNGKQCWESFTNEQCAIEAACDDDVTGPEPLYAHPPGGLSVEEVARIIDERALAADIEAEGAKRGGAVVARDLRERRAQALKKAQAILAAGRAG